ncbi:MAG: TRAP transporter TatT component family protein [Acidobacteriota bacterium]
MTRMRYRSACGSPILPWTVVPLIWTFVSCSLKQRAVNTLAEVLGEGQSVYLADDDPELIAAALPFNIKTIETLLASSPNHRGLLLAATTSITLYTYGFVEPEAQRMEDEDFDRAEEVRQRAARLYMRAFHYGVRGLEVAHPGFGDSLPCEPEHTVSALEEHDVPLAVWTAAALGAAIGVAKDDPEMTADIAVVGALLHRAVELDEDFEQGTIHELLLSYEAERVGGSKEKARQHYQRAYELSQGKHCSLWLSWAESMSVAEQNRDEFEELLDRVLSFDVDTHPENRLLNLLAQRRARWLRGRIDELFLEGETQ